MEDTKYDSKKNKLKHPQLHGILFMNQNNSKFEKKSKIRKNRIEKVVEGSLR